jgi:hypothetical protein
MVADFRNLWSPTTFGKSPAPDKPAPVTFRKVSSNPSGFDGLP